MAKYYDLTHDDREVYWDQAGIELNSDESDRLWINLESMGDDGNYVDMALSEEEARGLQLAIQQWLDDRWNKQFNPEMYLKSYTQEENDAYIKGED